MTKYLINLDGYLRESLTDSSKILERQLIFHYFVQHKKILNFLKMIFQIKKYIAGKNLLKEI